MPAFVGRQELLGEGMAGKAIATDPPGPMLANQRNVAFALVRCGVGGAIALADCDRAAQPGAARSTGLPGWAGLLVCRADPAASVLRRRRCC